MAHVIWNAIDSCMRQVSKQQSIYIKGLEYVSVFSLLNKEKKNGSEVTFLLWNNSITFRRFHNLSGMLAVMSVHIATSNGVPMKQSQ